MSAASSTAAEAAAPSTAGGEAARQLRLEELGTPLIETTFVVLDLETTGLDPSTDRITEVGAVKVRGGEVLGELRTFVHPGRPIPGAVTAITGITDAMVADAPRLEAVIGHVLDFLGPGVLVAHNAAFDLAFLRAAAAGCDRGPLRPTVVDTARLSRRLLGSEVRDHRLATIARHLRARTAPEHRALADARATVDVLHGLIERAGSHGATTVEDLIELGRSRSDRAFRRRGLVDGAPSRPGVYRFLDEGGGTLYVGRTKDLRSRLRTYFGQDPRRRIADMVRETTRVVWQETSTDLEAQVLELRAIHAEQPRYNRRSRTRHAPRWVVCTREPFPRLSVVAAPGPRHLHPLGPFDRRATAETVRAAIEEVMAVRTCSTRLRRSQDHDSCLLKDLGRCASVCDGTQDPSAYAAAIEAVAAIADDPTTLLERLAQRMEDHARDGRFERAAETRDLLHRTARALAARRDHAWLRASPELVLQHVTDDGTPVEVTLRHGALATATTTRHGLEGAPSLADAGLVDAGPADDMPDASWEEVELIRTWLGRHTPRLVATDLPLAVPLAGGAALAARLAEGRLADRSRRRDQQVLSAAKVRRRADGSADGRAVG